MPNAKARKYLEKHLEEIEKPYATAITTYALHLANSKWKDIAFSTLEKIAHEEGNK